MSRLTCCKGRINITTQRHKKSKNIAYFNAFAINCEFITLYYIFLYTFATTLLTNKYKHEIL